VIKAGPLVEVPNTTSGMAGGCGPTGAAIMRPGSSGQSSRAVQESAKTRIEISWVLSRKWRKIRWRSLRRKKMVSAQAARSITRSEMGWSSLWHPSLLRNAI
jgi:hypothetical protein